MIRDVKLTWLGALAVVLGACDEEVPPPADVVAPEVFARLIYPSGSAIPIDQPAYLINTADIRVELTADEPVRIHYTTDGVEPTPEQQGGNARNAVLLTFEAETIGEDEVYVRWLVEDLAGNRAPAGEVRLRFDVAAPTILYDPPPGDYDRPIEVTLDTDEPVDLIYWTINGGSPQASAGAESAPPPVTIQLTGDSVLRVAATDANGNRSETGALVYRVDAQPPTTVIQPPPGHYLTPVTVDITSDDPTGRIHFTVDGSEPTAASPVWAAPRTLDAATVVRYRGIDPGGNTEAVQVAEYVIGPRAPRAPALGDDAYDFPMDGGLRLAAALAEVAGPLAGRAGAPSTAHDWTAWATARTVIDAVVFQSAFGVHGLRAPAFGAYASGPDGTGDANGNGSILDDTFDARVAAMAARSGGPAPRGLHPLALFYAGAQAELLIPASAELTADGRPVWDDDYGHVRWEGARITDRVATPGATAAGLRALAARARIGTLGDHPAEADAWGEQVGPIIALRCGGCHRANQIAPPLARAEDLVEAGLVVPGDVPGSPLIDLLDGTTPHPVAPVPPAQLARVTAWINGGAEAVGAARAFGNDARDGLLAQLAAETAGYALDIATRWLFFDPATRRSADAADGTYHIARAVIAEAPSEMGLPRPVESIRPDLARFDTRAQARLALALAEYPRLASDRPTLFDGPLADDPRLPAAPGQAAPLLEITLAALRAQGRNADGGFVALREPGEPIEATTDALATAWALRALRAGGEADGVERASAELRSLRLPSGDWASAGEGGALEAERPTLEVQVVVLRALLDDAAAGDASSRAAAEALWDRLRGAWWDGDAGAFQTSLGLPDYVYTPAIAAAVVDALAGASRARLAEADAILEAFLGAVVLGGMRATEGWLTGELAHDRDGDGDGVPGIGGIAPDGVAPVFVRRVTF